MLKKYKVDNVNGEGWALIVLDLETGFFSTASDHGNYVYVWSQPGKEFRAFLLGMRPDYLFEKLMFGRSDKRVYDPTASIASIREAVSKLEESRGEGVRGEAPQGRRSGEWVVLRPR